MVKGFFSFLKILHYLSLDVVVGAMASTYLFWNLPSGKATINLPIVFILGISTWIIYIFDRLLDNLKTEPKDARHLFHSEYQYYLQISIIVLVFIAFVLIFLLPKNTIIFGLLLMLMVFSYFFVLHRKEKLSNYQYFKEIFTAFLYSVCVVGSVFSTKENLGWKDYLIAFNFFLLVHQSMLCFSFYESLEFPETKNLVTKLGQKYCTFSILTISVFMIICLFLPLNNYQQKAIIIEIMMAFSTTFVYLFRTELIANQHYRWLGEMVFWLPILLIFS